MLGHHAGQHAENIKDTESISGKIPMRGRGGGGT